MNTIAAHLPACGKTVIKSLLGTALLCSLVSCRTVRSPAASMPLVRIQVSPAGDDNGTGTAEAPFQTMRRAQQAAREAAKSATGNVVVELAAGIYRLDQPLTLTEADSGITYRSGDGIGKARLSGSVPLTGWQPYKDGIWKIDLPSKTIPHTLYENGRRAHKARFPNREYLDDFPCARGRYLLTEDGTEKPAARETRPASKEPGWLQYPAAEPLPSLSGSKTKLLVFTGGKCDWVRSMYKVQSIAPEACKLTFGGGGLPFGIGTGARFFIEDDLALLDAPGEFYADEAAGTLYYMPFGKGNPDALKITLPLTNRLIELKGSSQDACVSGVRLEGLTLEETDCRPEEPKWAFSGHRDGALIFMTNTTDNEIRHCHLRNSGRSGIMMFGHNVGNLVTGSLIEHMGLNGVSFCNHSRGKDKKSPTTKRCEHNHLHNTRITHVGEIHTYAECVTVFNASTNEVDHCQLDNSVRYAITVRGNTGAQYGPPITNGYPPSKGNHFHHIRVFRCGQDGGDMGALHGAALNNPGDGAVNTFEQITVADSAAIPSMKDAAPNGIFLDWPKMAMDQIFTNLHIVRSQGAPFRSHGRDNGASAQTTNVSWEDGFKTELMDYENIGLTADFPTEYGGRSARSTTPPAPRSVRARATAWDTVELTWQPPEHTFADTPYYSVYRDGEKVALVSEPHYTDRCLTEHTKYRYQIAAQDGDFCHLGPKSRSCRIRTLPDLTPPVVENVWSMGGSGNIRVRFSKAVARRSAEQEGNYVLDPGGRVERAKLISQSCVELTVVGLTKDSRLMVDGIKDNTVSGNVLAAMAPFPIAAKGRGAFYTMEVTSDGCLLDALGSAGDAQLHGGARVEPTAGPFGGPALVLNGEDAYAEASADFDLGAGDFTIMLWVLKTGGQIALSKGNGFESLAQWSFGWGNMSLRLNNVFHSAAKHSMPPKAWVHVAFVRRGKQGFTYVNGEPGGEPHDLSAVGDLTNDEPLRIGRRKHEPNPAWFKGRITAVKLLDYALSDDEIRAEANGGK